MKRNIKNIPEVAMLGMILIVAGASLVSLFNLLSRELFILVTIALIIASPLAWYVMNDWLQAQRDRFMAQ